MTDNTDRTASNISTVGESRRTKPGWLALIVSTACSLAACGGVDEQELELATSTQPVQAAYVASTETATNRGVNLVTTSSQTRKGKSTGAIRGTLPGGLKPTCGATFISHRYAITAAHCVDQYSTSQNFTVQQFNTTNLNMNAYGSQQQVSGTWPDYHRANKLTSAQGYSVANLSCRVTRRCMLSPVSCPLTNPSVDIALIHCSARSTQGLNWVPVATSDTGTQNIEVWWFHEVVNLATSSATPYAPYMPNHNWWHYGKYPPGSPVQYDENYHYWHSSADTDHQLLPLVSKQTSNNQPYRGLGHDQNDASVTRSNVPACHGTSGSGIFRSGSSDELLGPAIYGPGWAGVTLCAGITGSDPNMNYMEYGRATHTAQFQALSEIQNDRQ